MVSLRATCSLVRPSPVLNASPPSRICNCAASAFSLSPSYSSHIFQRKWRWSLGRSRQPCALAQLHALTSPALSLRPSYSQRLQQFSTEGRFLAGSEKGLRFIGTDGSARNARIAAASSSSPSSVATSNESTGLKELPKTFEFSSEERLYNWWESHGYFRPDSNQDGEPFVMSMPPPNVTGALHMGHAMFVTLQDIMTRHYRMRGRPTLWLPGTDHAGIATQLVVEKLLASEGVKRADLGREEFEKRVWEWKRTYGGRITNQLRRLGASCDWERERFTLDEKLSSAVVEAFVRLHEKGLIYRGSYMVNWSPNLQTAVSDLEVEYSEEPGTLYFFKYPVAGGNAEDYLPVATTRPETVLGDTAVAVHPLDQRYAKFVGKMAVVPMSGGREIPIIADEYVDREFGTGALKITPGHDPNDYAIGQKTGLPIINIMNKDGTLNENAGKYSGLDRFVARKQLWADLESIGLTIKKEAHTQRVPRSQRGGEVVEPLVSKQWFVTTGPLAEKALHVLESGELRIIPDRFEKIYVQWLTNIKDWCVSRQLWWGHRIPVWYVRGIDGAEEKYFVAYSEDDAYIKARAVYGDVVKLEQDPDVLDTWFSSGLWPFSTLGWPNTEAEDFQRFYPTAVLETGHDILFFWVARMVMMGLEFTGKSPFSTVYLHGLVRDAQGRKMSKSLGNVIDPLDTISEYGTDALRFTLATGTTPGQDVNLSMERLNANKAFTNKLWNAGKFILQNLPPISDDAGWKELSIEKDSYMLEDLALPERWVVTKLHMLIDGVTSCYEKYDFGEVGRAIYEFFWTDFADWYIEVSKTRLYKNEEPLSARKAQHTLVYVFTTVLKLLHPYMPFVTEELWQAMPHEGDALIISKWPQRGLSKDEQALQQFGDLQTLIRSIRNARAEYSVEPARRISAVIVANSEFQEYLLEEKKVLIALAKLDPTTLQFTSSTPREADQAVHLVIAEGLEAYLPLADMVDIGKEVERLNKQATKLQAEYESNMKRLSSSKFVDKAPADIVQGVKDKANEANEKLQILRKRLTVLDSMAVGTKN
ncbi:valyl-tRNA synthetase [Marchantia polymorpha subsp. ruderalis]|uniref:valine--tRNA ligase n=1 Tax=Marchantia polymorpha TaxID=3197 RepID=A0A2R6X2Y6_MARPO|nr:hypothetical protein MARPO_0040s0139 [Marchantia polymorpha]BBN03099.1 hypothetical protein Mp_2g20730 [Marchantia polymorpha subsp. ruderalis]|eukprot:PTQ40477.1 hypothetical protein MARPO_0040s0139 [Marchantia polymorpha]